MQLQKKHRCASGWVEFYQHDSTATATPMRFSIYRPSQAASRPLPVLYWLSGLTCTEENFMIKSGIQMLAEQQGIWVVAPDTSPRETGIAGEDERWDLGSGAGFYVNATQDPWSRHYRMYDYVVEELPSLIEREFPVGEGRAISGHSMGGHGAIVIGLRNGDRYRSISAFAPISHPSACPWGELAFRTYLGDDRALWDQYDSCICIRNAQVKPPLRVDFGKGDEFLDQQLRPQDLIQACRDTDYPAQITIHDGYDHSYYFVSTFLADHMRFHFESDFY